jgi:hypothetical protein
LLAKKDGLSVEEYIVQKAVIYFGMQKKIKDDANERIFGDENKSAIKDFEMGHEFLFITMASADMITFATAPPDPKNIKRKALLLIKARQEEDDD